MLRLSCTKNTGPRCAPFLSITSYMLPKTNKQTIHGHGSILTQHVHINKHHATYTTIIYVLIPRYASCAMYTCIVRYVPRYRCTPPGSNVIDTHDTCYTFPEGVLV